ncbi:MAG: hypothetical protein JJU05_18025 [Verrucomicrobia bacterium]|nr:hypothetical protein [Verrucomicrobiota bacterium]MCH8529083.1 hypothetical protein [Kiritimatiellia bacterium]
MKDLLRFLNQRGAAYAICGGFAVAHHGFVRMTLDLDILIDSEGDNPGNVLKALEDFGFGNAGITEEHLRKTSTAITLGMPPNQIDLLTRMSATRTSDILARATESEVDGIPVRVVSKADLIEAKQEANRPKDRIDIEELS